MAPVVGPELSSVLNLAVGLVVHQTQSFLEPLRPFNRILDSLLKGKSAAFLGSFLETEILLAPLHRYHHLALVVHFEGA